VALLTRIRGPRDLDRLTPGQLTELAEEIRGFLVEEVSKTGGHLGPNLGVVELTLALHRVFDSPNDRILWDTGHLAYVHKIVTGRRAEFETLRHEGGLSGYPSRAESEHDWIENSHASTIVSYAHGLATALERDSEDPPDRRIIAVIGDGSMTGGMAFEGLNNLGHSGRKAIIILNDNGRSYAPTISKLGDSVARLRVNPAYLRQRARLDRILRDVPLVGDRMERGLQAAVAAVREYFEPSAFFEDLGVRYTGPFDGHDVRGLEAALRAAAAYDGPIVVHVLTQKGRG
jgi:1-deoxy-D-xylulose-5-phosphate synthase